MKKSYLVTLLVVIAMLVVAGTLVGCKKKEVVQDEPIVAPSEPEQEPAEPEPVVPEGATIELTKFDVSTADVTVEAGATVTWLNTGETKHKIQVKSGKDILISSEMIEMDGEFSYTFEDAGEYTWLSAPYAGIVKGTVTVE